MPLGSRGVVCVGGARRPVGARPEFCSRAWDLGVGPLIRCGRVLDTSGGELLGSLLTGWVVGRSVRVVGTRRDEGLVECPRGARCVGGLRAAGPCAVVVGVGRCEVVRTGGRVFLCSGFDSGFDLMGS